MMGRLFNHRTRGFRTINLMGLALFVALALTVNLAKAYAGRERNQIDRIDRRIVAEQVRIRLLEAEVAHLEQPERLARLSRETLGMAPTGAKQEVNVEALPQAAGRPMEPVRLATAMVRTSSPQDAEPAKPAAPLKVAAR